MSVLAALARAVTSLAGRARAVIRHRGRASLGLIVPLIVVLVLGIDPGIRDELVSGISGGTGDQSQLLGRRTRATPTPTPRPEMRVIAVAAGDGHSLAVKSDGSVWAWGNNTYGQLGDGTFVWRREPTRVRGIRDATAVAAGASHSVALTRDGSVWAWGRNDRGQLGDGTTLLRTEPVRVGGLGIMTAIAAGEAFSLAVGPGGGVWAWGANDRRQLGVPGSSDRTVPARTRTYDDEDLSGITQVAAGTKHSVALRDDGTIWRWGHRYDPLNPTAGNLVGPIVGSAGFIAVAASGRGSQAIAGNGHLYVWGEHFSPWNGDLRSDLGPVFISDPTVRDVAGVAQGATFTVFVKRDGTVWSWGLNESGQLAREGTALPAQISGLQLARSPRTIIPSGGRRAPQPAIVAGGGHLIALSDDGRVWAWGRNDSGQVGDGTITERRTPFALTSLTR